MTLNPTTLTMRHLTEQGYTVEKVERWNAHAGVRQDLFGFVDVLALRGAETLAVQATSASNVSSRVKKIALCQHVAAVREAGWRIEVWGWSQKKPRAPWTVRIVDVS